MTLIPHPNGGYQVALEGGEVLMASDGSGLSLEAAERLMDLIEFRQRQTQGSK